MRRVSRGRMAMALLAARIRELPVTASRNFNYAYCESPSTPIGSNLCAGRSPLNRAPKKTTQASQFDASPAAGPLARAPKTVVAAVVVLADLVFSAGLFASKPRLSAEVPAAAQLCERGTCQRQVSATANPNNASIPTGKPRLLEFTSAHCASCGRMAPLVKRLELKCTAHDGTILPVDVDTDTGDQLATRYAVNELPTFIEVDSDGNEVSRLVGEQPRERLRVALADVNGVLCTEI